MKSRAYKAIVSLVLTAALALPPWAALAPHAYAEGDVIDINLSHPVSCDDYHYEDSTGAINVINSTNKTTVVISGDSTEYLDGKPNRYVVTPNNVTDIIIKNNTKIEAPDYQNALQVSNGATIKGMGGNISITGGTATDVYKGHGIYAETGDVTITGTIGAITGGDGNNNNVGSGIFADRVNVTISGTIGAITGGDVNSDGYGGSGIEAGKNVTIIGTIGAITGGKGGTGGDGISADAVNITGTTGAITGGEADKFKGGAGIKIFEGDVTISGTTGAITGGKGTESGVIGGDGINAYAGRNVTISGTTGAITGGRGGEEGGHGIYADTLDVGGIVTISGFVNGKIEGGSGSIAGKAISAPSYSVLDYTDGNILNIENCNPNNGNTVTFEYTPALYSGDIAPRRAYVTKNSTVPEPLTKHIRLKGGGTVNGWYGDAECKTKFDFNNLITDNGVIIYAGVLPPAIKSERDDPTLHTLTHGPTGVKVTAIMKSSTHISVEENGLPPAGEYAACDEIRARQAAGGVLALYDIALSGYHAGPYEVFIPFTGGEGVYTVLHCNNGVLEEQTARYANGGVTTVWQSLSPFAVVSGQRVAEPEEILLNPPKTGDKARPWGALLVVLAGVLALRVRRKRVTRH